MCVIKKSGTEESQMPSLTGPQFLIVTVFTSMFAQLTSFTISQVSFFQGLKFHSATFLEK